MSHKVTSKTVASDAARVLRDPRATQAERAAAGSALSQREPGRHSRRGSRRSSGRPGRRSSGWR